MCKPKNRMINKVHIAISTYILIFEVYRLDAWSVSLLGIVPENLQQHFLYVATFVNVSLLASILK